MHRYGFYPKCIIMCISRWYLLWKSFSTIVAFVWHLSCMFLCVMLKISVLQESLITISAQVWRLPSVYFWMYLKVIFLWEILFHNSYLYVVSCSEKRPGHNACMGMASPLCVFSIISEVNIFVRKSFHNNNIFVASLLCVSSGNAKNCCSARLPGHNGCIDMFFPQSVLSYVFQDDIFYEKAFPS